MTEKECRKLIGRHQEAPPVIVTPIAHDMGIRVYRTKAWQDDISGQILRSKEKGGKSGYAIVVNGLHARVRRRFTVAHEIAHFVLHRYLIGDGIEHDALYRSGLSSPIEVEANKLAADILMPWHLVHRAIFEGSGDLEGLAAKFLVSRSAMAIRLGIPYDTD